MTRRKAKTTLVVVLVACALGALFATATWNRAPAWPDLIAEARYPAAANTYAYAGVWVSNHQILMPVRVGRELIDVDSGAQTRVTGLTGRLNATPISASPDGRWLLWLENSPDSFPAVGEAVVTRLDGSGKVKFGDMLTGVAAWLPDSRHWVHCKMITPGGRAVLQECDIETGRCKDIRATGVTGDEDQIIADKLGNLLTTDSADDPTPDGFAITRIKLNCRMPSMSVTPIVAPKDSSSQLDQFTLSPDGSKIL